MNAKAGNLDLPHTRACRESALAKLEVFIEEFFDQEDDKAFERFWGRYLDRAGELTDELLLMSRAAQSSWFALDHDISGEGLRVVDKFLDETVLPQPERSFLKALRVSSMRLYEVTEILPGTSITLRDVIEGTKVTVIERSASRTVCHGDCLAARVIQRGCSGRPELEWGVLHIPSLARDQLVEQVKEYRTDYLRERPRGSLDDFYKRLPPLFHDAWVGSIFEPAVPRLSNADGEEMVVTRVSFFVDDEPALVAALGLAGQDGIVQSGDSTWRWSSDAASSSEPPIGTITFQDAILTVEVNSVERGVRARALIERLCGSAIRTRGTMHEDMRRKVMKAVTARILGKDEPSPDDIPGALDPEIAEALVLDSYAKHYRDWVDQPVPALGGKTPREAAKSAKSRSKVEDLIRDLEGLYERALKDGQPAYDPSWMWSELGLGTESDRSRPPPLAHERVAEQVPGSAEASRACAERLRAMPSFSDRFTSLSNEELQRDLTLQRFIRQDRPSSNDAGQEGALAAPYIPLMVNLDLHRRKVFWVDESLSFMLENTDLDIAGHELRAPFPSFAFVFADRIALSLGERLLARRKEDPLCGQILRVGTVYVTERHDDDRRVLDIVFAFDSLGADLPSLIPFKVPSDDKSSIAEFLESVAPPAQVDPSVRDTSPVRSLLRLVLNAILYATSAGVTPEVHSLAPRKRNTNSPEPPHSDSVFFLPGKIDIHQVRQLQEIRRAPEGGKLFSRFMVRGHWRRPAKNWTEQRLRWIEPYWKGPDMATIIEKAYRMKA